MAKKVIISEGRSNDVKTLGTIGFMKDIYIFTNQGEKDMYSQFGVPVFSHSRKNKNIAEIRNDVLKVFEKEKFIWILDDDVYDIYERSELSDNKKWWHLESIKDDEERIKNAFDFVEKTVKKNRFVVGGFSFRQRNFVTTDPYMINRPVSCFLFLDTDLSKRIGLFDENMYMMEDLEFFVRSIKMGYNIFADYVHAIGTPNMCSNEGGLHDFYVKEGRELSKMSTEYFIKKHGSSFVSSTRKKTHEEYGITEVKIQWAKLSKVYKRQEKKFEIDIFDDKFRILRSQSIERWLS